MSRAGKPGQGVSANPGDFLARWSRRKIEARDATALPDDADAETVSPPATDADAPPACEPEQVLTDADMPPVETLNADSDFSPFMSSGVSDGLRKKALRILFNQPGCNITDGLNDYDEDYTRFASLGSVVTHEMKRMLQRELEAERNRQQQADDRTRESHSAAADRSADAPVDPSLEQAQSTAAAQPEKAADVDVADKGQV